MSKLPKVANDLAIAVRVLYFIPLCVSFIFPSFFAFSIAVRVLSLLFALVLFYLIAVRVLSLLSLDFLDTFFRQR